MTAPVDELRIADSTGLAAVVRRINEWSRRVSQRFAEIPTPQIVPMRFDPDDLPLELAVTGFVPAARVELVSAIAIDDQADVISGGSVTWSVQSGFVRVSAVSALTGGTSYEARFEVSF